MLGNGIHVGDLIDLIVFKLAKLRRTKLKTDAHEFYEEFFTQKDNAVFHSGLDRRKTSRAAILRSAVFSKVPRGGAILDVGCGVGDNLQAILREHFHLCGVEYAAASVAFARAALPSAVCLLQASATDLPFRKGYFDSIVCIEVLEHIDDHYQALREIKRVLKPGGKLILSVPYRRWFPAYYTHMGHYRHYTRSGLARILKSVGFVIAEYLPNYPRWSRVANYCYVACRIVALTLRVCGMRRFPHEVRLPFMKTTLMDWLFDRVEYIRVCEEKLDYDTLETSTFVCCHVTACATARRN